MKGLKRLVKRADVVDFQTDKSSRFSIDDKANYIKANEKHVENDDIIDEQPNVERDKCTLSDVDEILESW